MAFKCVEVLDSPLIGGKTLAKCRSFILNVELDTGIGNAEELEDTFVMGDPRSERHPFSAEENVVLMRWNVIECDGVRLDSTSSQFPNLVAPCSVVEMLIVSGIWHVHC